MSRDHLTDEDVEREREFSAACVQIIDWHRALRAEEEEQRSFGDLGAGHRKTRARRREVTHRIAVEVDFLTTELRNAANQERAEGGEDA